MFCRTRTAWTTPITITTTTTTSYFTTSKREEALEAIRSLRFWPRSSTQSLKKTAPMQAARTTTRSKTSSTASRRMKPNVREACPEISSIFLPIPLLLSVEIAKKALSAAAALSDRSEASPAFMLWTVPTTLLSILGLFYFVSK